MLPCGKHPCPKKCHIGPCGNCPIMVNGTLSCACGNQRVGPPIKCGQPHPYCDKICDKILQCGHSCYYKCHFGDCKPCQEIIEKKCNCGNTTIKAAICSIDYKCTKPCNKDLGCGHKCSKICHLGDCEEIIEKKRVKLKENGSSNVPDLGCLQQCFNPREACGHPCQELCHPGSECPITPCEIKIKITCQCGMKILFY